MRLPLLAGEQQRPQLLHGLILTINPRRTMVCDSHGRIGVDDKSGVATGLVVFQRQKNFHRLGRGSSRNLFFFELGARPTDSSLGLAPLYSIFDHSVELRLSVFIRLQKTL